jgi:hypothetical protein
MRFGMMVIVFALCPTAWAFPPPGTDHTSPTALWYQSLRAPGTSESCCGVSDCLDLPVRIFDRHYQVQFNGNWLDVPDHAILRDGPNPVGHAVSCVAADYRISGEPRPRVVCFKPMVGT